LDAKESIGVRSAAAMRWGIAGSIARLAGQFAIQVVLARLLGPSEYGRFAAVLVVVYLGNLLSEGGFGTLIVQRQHLTESHVRFVLGWTLVTSCLAAGTIASLAPLIASWFADPGLGPLLQAASALVVVNSVTSVSVSLLVRDLRQKALQAIQVFCFVFGYGCLSIVLAALGWGAWALVVGYAVQVLLMMVASYSLTRHPLRPSFIADWDTLLLGFHAMLSNFATWAMEALDRFTVGLLWGVTALGQYAVAFNLAKAPVGALVDNVQKVVFASIARSQDDPDAMRKGHEVVITSTMLLTLPLFALIALNAHAVLFIIYGERWLDAGPYLQGLAVAVPMMALGNLTSAVLRGMGAVRAELTGLLVSCAILLVGFISLADLSLSLAVWSVPAAYAARLILVAVILHRLSGINALWQWSVVRGAVMLTLVAVGMAEATSGLFYRSPHNISPLLTGLGAGMLATCVWPRIVLGVPLFNMAAHWFRRRR
jgi:lipopolysaccharide exporter